MGTGYTGMQSLLIAEVFEHSATALLVACHMREVRNIADADMCWEMMLIMQTFQHTFHSKGLCFAAKASSHCSQASVQQLTCQAAAGC